MAEKESAELASHAISFGITKNPAPAVAVLLACRIVSHTVSPHLISFCGACCGAWVLMWGVSDAKES